MLVDATLAYADSIINGEVKLFEKYMQLIQRGVVKSQQALEKLPQVLAAMKFQPSNDPNTVKMILDILSKMTSNEYDR